jgi:nucleoside 2-deoxyribosyltransferase
MKVYLAGSWSDRPNIRKYRDLMEARGIFITSRWLDWTGRLPGESREEELRRSANVDLQDIDMADGVLIFTGVPSSHGGFHTELGYAIGTRKPVAIIGPRPSNFFQLEAVQQFQDVDDFVASITA